MNKMPWFRAYTEMVDDEKLRLLAFEDRWHFVALLCLKGQGILDNEDPLMMRKVAVKLGIDIRTLEDVARRLGEVGLIGPETLQPLAWDSRQMRSDADPTNAERQKRYRARQKIGESESPAASNAQSNGNSNALRNARITPLDTDTDTDKDKETEEDKHLCAVGPGRDTFEQAWTIYPKRAGGNSKAAARKAWNARVKSGVDPDDMLAGTQRYAAYCLATGRVGTQFVRQAATFFGPDLHFEDDFDIPVQQGTKADRHAAWNARMNEVLAQALSPQQHPIKDMGAADVATY